MWLNQNSLKNKINFKIFQIKVEKITGCFKKTAGMQEFQVKIKISIQALIYS